MQNKTPNKEHDKIFKIALENRKELVEIINEILRLKGKEKIKKEEIEEYKTEYITKIFEGRQADKIYKVKGKEIYFLIEHQTKEDKKMAFRILEYKVEIIRDVIKKNKSKNKYKIPKIIAIVIYSGKAKWKAIKDIKEKEEKYKDIEQDLGKYYLYDGREKTKEELIKSKNIILQMLLIERSKNKEELGKNLEEIIPYVENENKGIIKNIIQMVYREKLGEEKTEEILKNMKEGENMLAVVEMMRKEAEKDRRDLIRARKEGRATGLKDGRVLGLKEGLKDGIKEGIIKIAKRLLKLNYDTNSIKEITGLKEEEIEKLKNFDNK